MNSTRKCATQQRAVARAFGRRDTRRRALALAFGGEYPTTRSGASIRKTTPTHATPATFHVMRVSPRGRAEDEPLSTRGRAEDKPLFIHKRSGGQAKRQREREACRRPRARTSQRRAAVFSVNDIKRADDAQWRDRRTPAPITPHRSPTYRRTDAGRSPRTLRGSHPEETSRQLDEHASSDRESTARDNQATRSGTSTRTRRNKTTRRAHRRTAASIRTKRIPDDAQWRDHLDDKRQGYPTTRSGASIRTRRDETTRRRAAARASGRRGYPTRRTATDRRDRREKEHRRNDRERRREGRERRREGRERRCEGRERRRVVWETTRDTKREARHEARSETRHEKRETKRETMRRCSTRQKGEKTTRHQGRGTGGFGIARAARYASVPLGPCRRAHWREHSDETTRESKPRRALTRAFGFWTRQTENKFDF